MELLTNDLLRREGEDGALGHRERSTEPAAAPSELESGPAALGLVLDAPDADVPARPIAAAGEDLAPTRDLVDLYLRQMGNGELLSREDEIALAKRIEAAQQAVLTGLCHVPDLVQRIAGWGQEVVAGQRRLADLVDLSSAEFAEPADRPQSEEEAPSDLPSDPEGETVARESVSREIEQARGLAPRLERLSTLAGEIRALAEKRLLAISRGRALAKRTQLRLQELVWTFA